MFARAQVVEVEADPVRPTEFFTEQPDPFAILRNLQGDAVARIVEDTFAVTGR